MNNALICLALFIPGFGVYLTFLVGYDLGIIISALSTAYMYDKTLLIEGVLFSPIKWLEFTAYALAASEGVMVLFALFTKRLTKESRKTLLMFFGCMSFIITSAIIEFEVTRT